MDFGVVCLHVYACICKYVVNLQRMDVNDYLMAIRYSYSDNAYMSHDTLGPGLIAVCGR